MSLLSGLIARIVRSPWYTREIVRLEGQLAGDSELFETAIGLGMGKGEVIAAVVRVDSGIETFRERALERRVRLQIMLAETGDKR